MADDNSVIIQLQLDKSQADKVIKSLESDSKKKGEKAGSNFAKGFRKTLNSGLGKAAGILGLGLAFRRAAQDLVQFDKAMGEVRTITQGLGIDQKALRDQLIATSAEFGTSAAEQTKSFYQIISAGVTDAAKATELLTAANKLAIGGLTSTTGAIDLLTSAVNAFGQENLSAARASDIIFGTVKLGKTRVEELQSSLGLILPSAKAIGVSFEEVSGGLAQLTTKGISTSTAVTQLNAVFTAVLKKQDTAAKMGPAVAKAFSLQSLQTKGLTGFMKDLNIALGGSQEKLTKLMGRVEGSKAIMALGADGFEGMSKKIKELQGSSGAADDAFKEMAETLEFKMNDAVSTVDAIFIKLGSTTSGPLAKALDYVNEQLNEVLDAFSMFENAGDFMDAFVLNISLELKKLDLALITTLENLGKFGKWIGVGLVGQSKAAVIQDIADLEKAILDLLKPETVEKLAANGKAAGEAAAKSLATGVKSTLDAVDVPTVTNTFKSIGGSIKGSFFEAQLGMSQVKFEALDSLQQTQVVMKQMEKNSKAMGKQMMNGIGQGAGNAFAAFGKAVANGEDALGAFINSLLASMGQMAIQLGTQFILQGVAYMWAGLPNGPSLIAAGAGLAAFGGLLSGLGGGSESTGTGSTATTETSSPLAQQEQPQIEEPKPEVQLIVQGDVLDKRETGLALVDVLNEVIGTSDARVFG